MESVYSFPRFCRRQQVCGSVHSSRRTAVRYTHTFVVRFPRMFITSGTRELYATSAECQGHVYCFIVPALVLCGSPSSPHDRATNNTRRSTSKNTTQYSNTFRRICLFCGRFDAVELTHTTRDRRPVVVTVQ